MADEITEAQQTVTPYLVVDGAEKLIAFLMHVFGGTLVEHMKREDGAVMHAEVRIGHSVVMVSDSTPGHPPETAMLYVNVPNADAAYTRALERGAQSIQTPADQFYGHRTSAVRDPHGNAWWIWHRLETVSPEELDRRAREAAKAAR